MASGAAKRYAQAVFQIAKEQGTLDAWQTDLQLLDDLMDDEIVAQFFESPSVSPEQKLETVEQVLAKSQPEALNLARLLIERQRMNVVRDLFHAFSEMRLAEQGIAIAEVTTAEPLDPESQAIVQRRLEELVGKQVQLRMRTDPDLIGGVVARVGDMLIDGSVINQLRRLRARLAASA